MPGRYRFSHGITKLTRWEIHQTVSALPRTVHSTILTRVLAIINPLASRTRLEVAFSTGTTFSRSLFSAH